MSKKRSIYMMAAVLVVLLSASGVLLFLYLKLRKTCGSGGGVVAGAVETSLSKVPEQLESSQKVSRQKTNAAFSGRKNLQRVLAESVMPRDLVQGLQSRLQAMGDKCKTASCAQTLGYLGYDSVFRLGSTCSAKTTEYRCPQIGNVDSWLARYKRECERVNGPSNCDAEIGDFTNFLRDKFDAYGCPDESRVDIASVCGSGGGGDPLDAAMYTVQILEAGGERDGMVRKKYHSKNPRVTLREFFREKNIGRSDNYYPDFGGSRAAEDSFLDQERNCDTGEGFDAAPYEGSWGNSKFKLICKRPTREMIDIVIPPTVREYYYTFKVNGEYFPDNQRPLTVSTRKPKAPIKDFVNRSEVTGWGVGPIPGGINENYVGDCTKGFEFDYESERGRTTISCEKNAYRNVPA